MPKTTFSTFSLEDLQQDPARVCEAADNGPVLILRAGGSPVVLIAEEEYRRLGGPAPTILDLLAMPGIGEIEFEPPRMGDTSIRVPDLSV